jgi:hypothetical protein
MHSRFTIKRRKLSKLPSMNTLRKFFILTAAMMVAVTFRVHSAEPGAAPAPAGPGPAGRGGVPGGGGRSATPDHPRTLAPYFTSVTTSPKSPDKDGFLQRWLLLEPINKSIRGNTIFTDTYVRDALNTEYFPNQFSVIPQDGDKVKVGDQELIWHALDSSLFNVKLFRFADGLSKQTYSVIFWAVTVVESPREMKNVRLAVGSNSASMWWVNGKEAVGLFGDRRMVMDDCVSKRITLNKGKNVIRGAVINGPGMSDFCVRFIDENGDPIKDITIQP